MNATIAETSICDVYPNLATDNITLRVIKEDRDAVFNVFDGRGQLLLSENNFLPQGASEVEFKLSELPAGLYIVKGDGVRQHSNFVIMKKIFVRICKKNYGLSFFVILAFHSVWDSA